MATINLSGNPVPLAGEFPRKGETAKNFTGVKHDLSEFSLEDFRGERKVLNIFPSIDTDVCAVSVKKFNKKASEADKTQVICLSFDLPFAHKRFCSSKKIENVITGSLFRNPDFGKDYGVLIMDGVLKGLTARAVIVLDEDNKVLHSELVDDITMEPDYESAFSVL